MLKGSRPSPIGARNGSLHAFFTQACTLNLMHSCRQDGSGLDIANAWWVDVTVHYVRKVSYRGHRAQVNRNRLKLPFDGLTFPATLFTVPWTCLKNNDPFVKRARSSCTRNTQVCSVLQTQGCRPQMQETTLSALRVLLTSCLDHAFDIALVPGLEEGS